MKFEIYKKRLDIIKRSGFSRDPLTFISLLLILILGTALRLYELGKDSFWMDEVFTTIRAHESISSIIQGTSIPLHNLFVHVALYFGKSEFIIRFPSVIFGVLSIFLLYKIGKEFYGTNEGIIAAFLLSISQYHIRYSREARFYSPFVFFSLLTLFFFYKAIKENKRIWWIGFLLSTILNIFTHLYAWFVLAIEFSFILLLLVQNKFSRESKSRSIKEFNFEPLRVLCNTFKGGFSTLRGVFSSRRDTVNKPFIGRRRNKIYLLVLGLIVTASLFVIISYLSTTFLKVFDSFYFDRSGRIVQPKPLLGFYKNIFSVYSANRGLANANSESLKILNIFLIFFLIGTLSSIKKYRTQISFLFLWIILPYIILNFLWVIVKVQFYWNIRYVIFLLPIYLLIVSKGITISATLGGELVGRLVNLKITKTRNKQLMLSLLLVIVVFGRISLTPIRKQLQQPPLHNWKGTAEYLSLNAQPGDIIISSYTGDLIPFLYYYSPDWSFVIEDMHDYYKFLENRYQFNVKNTTVISDFKAVQNLLGREFIKGHGNIWMFTLGLNRRFWKKDKDFLNTITILDTVKIKGRDSTYIYKLKISKYQINADQYLNTEGWFPSTDQTEGKVMVTFYTKHPNATISYKIFVPWNETYDLYIKKSGRDDTATLDYKIDGSDWLKSDVDPFKECFVGSYRDIKLSTRFLSEGEHTISFLNTNPYMGEGYQSIASLYISPYNSSISPLLPSHLDSWKYCDTYATNKYLNNSYNFSNILVYNNDGILFPSKYNTVGSITYRFERPMTITSITVRLFSYVVYDNNYVKIYVSPNGRKYTLMSTIMGVSSPPSHGLREEIIDPMSVINGSNTAFVRIEMYVDKNTSVTEADARLEALEVSIRE